MTIRLKLFLSFLGVTLVPLALLGAQFYVFTQKAFTESIKARLTSLAMVQRDRLQANYVSGTLTQDRILLVADGYYDFLGVTGETMILAPDGQGGAVLQAPRRFGDAPPSPGIVAAALEKKDGFKEDVVDAYGKHVFVATAYLPDKDWIVVVKIDRDEVLSPFGSLISGPLLISLIFVVLAAAFVAIVITQSFLAPIRDLTDVTRAISLGNLRVSIDPETLAAQDEIGDLGRAFDRTVISLKLAMSDIENKSSARKEEKR